MALILPPFKKLVTQSIIRSIIYSSVWSPSLVVRTKLGLKWCTKAE